MKKTGITVKNKKLYKRYQDIKKRCYNEKCNSYYNYGKRGIKICDEWLGEDGFYNFLNWAVKNGYREELQIDRIDVNGNYKPSNCRWVDRKTNANNRRNSIRINGKTLNEIAKEMNYTYDNIWRRYKKYGDIKIPNKICKRCQKVFEPYRNNQSYCSKECYEKDRRISNKIPCLQNH